MPVVDSAADPSGGGYWNVHEDGTVVANDGATHHGELATGSTPAAIEPTATGNGYWVLTEDGGVFAYGDAAFAGSAYVFTDSAADLAPTPTGDGYWVASGNGAVFAFGDAAYHGGVTHLDLEGDIVQIQPTEAGDGYWLLGADGGVFALGDTPYHGSAPQDGSTIADATRLVPSPATRDYFILTETGFVANYGDTTQDLPTASLDPGEHYVDVIITRPA